MLSTLTSLYAYIYCMMVSQALTAAPVYGGALFMCARVATVFGQAFSSRSAKYLPPRVKPLRWALLAVLLLLKLLVVVLYPLALQRPHVWLLFALVLSMQVRDTLCLRLTRLRIAGRLAETRYMIYAGLWHAVAGGAVLAVLFSSLEASLALPMLGGYLLCSLVSYYSMLRQRDRMAALQEDVGTEGEMLSMNLRKANAYMVFERLTALILAAMEMTLIVMYTYLAATAEQLLIRMAMAVLTTLVCEEAAGWFLRWRRTRSRSDLSNLTLLGLIMWIVGLWRFSRTLLTGETDLTAIYVCLGLCSVGCALCAACMEGMEKPMQAVARYTSGDVTGYRQLREASRELASLLGQMLALAALTALCFMAGDLTLPDSVAAIAASFRPVMVIPALLTVVMALVCALRFPLNNRYVDKLMRLLHIRESGGENEALEKQLESVVIRRHTQPWLIRALMALLRPAFRHTLKGEESIVPDETNPIVFLCNHGEVYGPVAGMLFTPVPVRSWSISDMMIDPLEVAQYSYKYTFSQVKWLGPLRWPVARVLGYISVWGMKKLEAVPVFRNKPRELMTTFRKSVEAMQAGDNLLIFPENPDADPNAPGYEDGRPGELFRGFPMLAQVYWNKTGKRCRFLPMLAHKGMRTLSFGTEIVYDPDNAPIDERDRIVEEATAQMQALFEREEALFRKKHDK